MFITQMSPLMCALTARVPWLTPPGPSHKDLNQSSRKQECSISMCAGLAAALVGADGGFTLTSNYTTDAVTVAAVSGLCCSSSAPAFPVVETNISAVHKVR